MTLDQGECKTVKCNVKVIFMRYWCRLSPAWGRVYKDFVNAIGELRKSQNTVQKLMSRVGECSSLPPSIPIPSAIDSTDFVTKVNICEQFECEVLDGRVLHSYCNNGVRHDNGDCKIESPTYTKDMLELFLVGFAQHAQKIFPGKSMLLFQSKLKSMLLFRTNCIVHQSEELKTILNFLFPLNACYFPSFLDSVEKYSSSILPLHTDDIEGAEIQMALNDLIESVLVDCSEDYCMALTNTEIQVLVGILSGSFSLAEENAKAILFHLDFYNFDMLSILCAIFVHFFMVETNRVETTQRTKDVKLETFLKWLRNICEKCRCKDRELANACVDGRDKVLNATREVHERNFEFNITDNDVLSRVSIPVCLRQFFTWCHSGTFFCNILQTINLT